MSVYIVMHKPRYGARVRGVFSTREQAEEYIGSPAVTTSTCYACKSKITARHHEDEWRQGQLSIEEWIVTGLDDPSDAEFGI